MIDTHFVFWNEKLDDLAKGPRLTLAFAATVKSTHCANADNNIPPAARRIQTLDY